MEFHLNTQITTYVSIRAPTRGAMIAQQKAIVSDKFQSAPPREGRYHALGAATGSAGVSIRAPTRGAIVGETRIDCQRDVSIRAPTRGAIP